MKHKKGLAVTYAEGITILIVALAVKYFISGFDSMRIIFSFGLIIILLIPVFLFAIDMVFHTKKDKYKTYLAATIMGTSSILWVLFRELNYWFWILIYAFIFLSIGFIFDKLNRKLFPDKK